jgi:hypothetical protein
MHKTIFQAGSGFLRERNPKQQESWHPNSDAIEISDMIIQCSVLFASGVVIESNRRVSASDVIVKFQIIVISNTVVGSNISWLFDETVKFWILVDVWVMVHSDVIGTVAEYSFVLYKSHLKISFIINVYIHLIINKLYEKPTYMWYIPYISKNTNKNHRLKTPLLDENLSLIYISEIKDRLRYSFSYC